MIKIDSLNEFSTLIKGNNSELIQTNKGGGGGGLPIYNPKLSSQISTPTAYTKFEEIMNGRYNITPHTVQNVVPVT